MRNYTDRVKTITKKELAEILLKKDAELRDLKRQAKQYEKEAQIEAAFQRVRVGSMAMHRSEQLAGTAKVLFEQFGLLGKIPDRMSIGIINEEKKLVALWVTDSSRPTLITCQKNIYVLLIMVFVQRINLLMP